MQIANALLARRKRAEDEAVDRGDSRIEYIIHDVHSVDPVFVNTSVPEELHHDEELGELGDLSEDNQADIEAQRLCIVF